MYLRSDKIKTEQHLQMTETGNNDDLKTQTELLDRVAQIEQQISMRIVGQKTVIRQLLIALFTDGHVLLVGVPGLAKTRLVQTLAQVLSLEFSRIQFTPDLMPADITGTEVIQEDKLTGQRELAFMRGPVFGNIVLADEINRTPPKTQAALLEAMQERQVTIGRTRHDLPSPFFVLATQNPIEHEGTYPLPEAQLDRFMFQLVIDYPTAEEELEIVKLTTSDNEAELDGVLSADEIQSFIQLVRRMPIADHVARFAIDVARATRPDAELSTDSVEKWVQWGAGPRASQFMVLGAKAHALLEGRHAVEYADILAVAPGVLRHRVRLNFSAEAEGRTVDDVIQHVLDHVQNITDQDRLSAEAPEILRTNDAS